LEFIGRILSHRPLKAEKKPYFGECFAMYSTKAEPLKWRVFFRSIRFTENSVLAFLGPFFFVIAFSREQVYATAHPKGPPA
jgi:hypothetical protein